MNPARPWLQSRLQLAVLLAAVFVANFVETQLEEAFKPSGTYALGYRVAQAFHEIEGGWNFTGAARADRAMVAGYALAYFALFPVLLVGTAVAAWRRPTAGPLRVFSLAIALNYLLALPFFLLLPVPERWAFPGAKATLMSDLLSTKLIELVRPISGLDNCFPSMHVALSCQVVLLAYWSRSRWRHSLACLGGLVMLSTFFLGIHWMPDMVMGVATAGLSFGLAVQWNLRWYGEGRPGRSGHVGPAPRPRPGSRSPWRTAIPFAFPRPAAGKLVFISYRREGGSRLARVVQMELERRGYPCFLDVDDLGAEHFDERLLQEIERAPNLVLVLAPGSLDRCRQPDDWLRREISHALRHGRNIVPLLAEGFHYPPLEELPAELHSLPRLNGVVYSHEYFGAAFDKLEGFLRRE
ncbi:MAG: TIR domain-containing protein [Verrucomicrobia bacterium]|nr:TIR domain-containing protein [Verrucomicrobiota bacterium]